MSSSRRSPSGRRTPCGQRMLNVKMRSATARRHRQRLLMGFSAAVIGILLLCGTAWFGLGILLDRFFFSNPAYTVTALELDLDGILSPEDFRAESGLREGNNIFKSDIAFADRQLRAIPMVADVSIERILPDRIRVDLVSRIPVAWVSPDRNIAAPFDATSMLLVDGSGFLMRPRLIPQEFHNLPVIHGVDTAGVMEGKALQNDDLRKALALLDEAASRTGSVLQIRSLDISKGYCIDAITDQNARVKFGTKRFDLQLDKLERLLVHCAETGRELDSVNLMVEKNTPVNFVMVALPAPAPKSPTPKTARH